MGYPTPFMAPPMNSAPRTHDNKSPANTNTQNGAANGGSPSPLNSQAGGMPMYPPYLMNPMSMQYFPMHFPMQSQAGPNANAGSTAHYANQPNSRGYAASRGPANPSTASYEQDESHFYNNRSYDAYSAGGYHPTSHHGQAHTQDQKPYGQDSSKSSYDGHSYDAFGHGGSFSH